MSVKEISCYLTKEEISDLSFSNKEVLENIDQKKILNHYLNRAVQLGNLLKNKVDIYFKDKNDHLLRVQTTIWAVTKRDIILKKGTIIPKNRIIYID